VSVKGAPYERLHFLATVAHLYYTERLSQEAIAQQLGYSRSAISRFLTEAQELGVVEIRIHYPIQRAYDLEQKLRDHFALETIQVIHRAGRDYPQMLRMVGQMGATYFDQVLPANAIVGISWGAAVHQVASALRHRTRRGSVVVVQMMGSVGDGDPAIDGPEVARNFAMALDAQYQILPAPVIVKDRQTRDQLRAERQIQDVLDLAQQADLALVGIGSIKSERSGLVRAGHVSPEEMHAFEMLGAVGDICGTLYDSRGEVMDIDFNHRLLAVDLPALSRNSYVIGVAGGVIKAPAILGALRGGFMKALITDSSAAEAVLGSIGH
jgi:deoxyribonucleoside regulator